MGSRKRYLKRLCIPEYPWSSDDDEEEPPTDPRPSPATPSRPSTSGQQAAPSTSSAASPGRAEATRSDRDLYWSILRKGNVPPSTSTHSQAPNRGNSSRAGETQLPFVPRNAHSLLPQMMLQRWNRNHNNIEHVLAFKRITRNLNLNGPRSRYTIPRTNASGSNPGTVVPSEATSSTGQSRRERLTATSADGSLYTSISATELASRYGKKALESARRARRRAHSGGPSGTTTTHGGELSTATTTNEEPEESLPSTSRAADGADAAATEETHDQNAETEIELAEPEAPSSNNTSGVSLEEVVEIPDETGALDPAVVDLMQYDDSAAVVPSSKDPNLASTSRADETDAPELAQSNHGVKRKRRESTDSRGEPSTVKEFNLNLLRLLECPVCLEWMEPPMSQCRRGHLVCSRCRVRLASCPVCRTTFSSVRNRAMEGVAELVRFPCRHGCGREVRLRRRAPHEASCPARKYACPAPSCLDKPGYARAHLAEHFHAKHMHLVKLGCNHKFSMKVNMEHHDNYMIMAMNECFHLKVDVDIRTWGVIVYVSYIGPKCYSQDFAYEVIIDGENNSRRLTYKRATHSDLENTSLSVSRQDCFHLTLDQTLNFIRFKGRNCDSERYLDFSVEVSKIEPPPSRSDSDS